MEETEGLLSRKMTELKAAVEAKVTACENASEWESKWTATNQKVKELEKKDRSLLFSRRSLEAGSFHNSRTERRPNQWFRLRSRQDSDSFKSTESNVLLLQLYCR